VRGAEVGGAEVGEPDLHVVIHHAVTQHVERAPLVDLRRQPGDELRLGAGQAGVELLGPLPRVSLGGADELEQVLGVDPDDRVERRRPRLTRTLQIRWS
jgi:hypothetical protein